MCHGLMTHPLIFFAEKLTDFTQILKTFTYILTHHIY